MQGRLRNPNDNGRGYNSNYRRFNRSGSGGGGNRKSWGPPPPPPPAQHPVPRGKEEILMEAGRLAAEYLVYKGLLPPNSLPPKWQTSSGFTNNFKGRDRDSALNRLGNADSDVNFGKRRYNDGYNDFRGKRRMDGYGRDWGRENGRWGDRGRGYNGMDDDEDDEFGNGYRRDRRGGFGQLPTRSEGTVESGSESHDVAEDTGSKVSSSSTRKEQELPSEVDESLNKGVGEDERNGKVSDSGTNDEVKSEERGDGDSKMNNEEVEGTNVGPSENEEDSKVSDDLIKLCGFSGVPTKPRSAVTQRSPKVDEVNTTEASNGEPMVTSEELPSGQTDSKKQTEDDLSLSSSQPGMESVDKQQEESQSAIVIKGEDMSKKEGLKRERENSAEDEFSPMQKLKAEQSSPIVEKPPVVTELVILDDEMAEPVEVDQEAPAGDDFFPKSDVKMEGGEQEEEEEEEGEEEEENNEGERDEVDVEGEGVEVEGEEVGGGGEEGKQLLPASFKICDLNLVGAPEITEIPDDPEPDQHQPSTSSLETGKEHSIDFGLSIGNSNNGAEGYSSISCDDKVVQVIDLDDDCPLDGNVCDVSKPKDEPIYPNFDSFLNQTEHADLPGIQDGYSLSEFLESDIPRCPSVPSDLNNLQSGMGLHDNEGVPNDDDSIYVSLGEIPIGFEVWDQSPQEYGKFF